MDWGINTVERALVPRDLTLTLMHGGPFLFAAFFAVYGPEPLMRAQLHPLGLLSGVAITASELSAAIHY